MNSWSWILRLTQYLQWPVALLLILAATMKLHELTASPFLNATSLPSRYLASTLVVFEVLLAIWLVSGLYSRLAKTVSIVVFSVFAISNLSKLLVGAESCGCYGAVQVRPGFSFLINFFAILVLGFWRPMSPPAISKLWFFAAIASTFSILSATFLSESSFTELSQLGTIDGKGEVVVIDTTGWVGRPLPLAQFLSGDREYLTGTWEMILFHESCDVCRGLIEESLNSRPDGPPRVFVEIPPYQSPKRDDRNDLIWRKLTDDYSWFVAAPQRLRIVDGVVVAVVNDGLSQ